VYAAKNGGGGYERDRFHQFYYSLGAVTSTVPPSQDPTNWAMGNYYCDGYFPDWNSIGFAHPIVRPQLLLGPTLALPAGIRFQRTISMAAERIFLITGGIRIAQTSRGRAPTSDTEPGFRFAADPHCARRSSKLSQRGAARHATGIRAGCRRADERQRIGAIVLRDGANRMQQLHRSWLSGIGELFDRWQPDHRAVRAQLRDRVNIGFSTQNGIGVVSQDGLMLGWSSDFQNSRGDTITGAPTCATNNTLAGGGPITAQYQWNAESLVPWATLFFAWAITTSGKPRAAPVRARPAPRCRRRISARAVARSVQASRVIQARRPSRNVIPRAGHGYVDADRAE